MGERGLSFDLFLDRFVVPSGLLRDDKKAVPVGDPGQPVLVFFHKAEGD